MSTLALQQDLIFRDEYESKIIFTRIRTYIFSDINLLFLFYKKIIYCNAEIKSEFINLPASYELNYKAFYKINQTGYFSITGHLPNENMVIIHRVINYKVLEKNNDLLTLQIIFTRNLPQDNILDNLFNKYFKVLSDDAVMYLNISQLKEIDYLISGTLGPYFICKSEWLIKKNQHSIPLYFKFRYELERKFYEHDKSIK